ncbi:transposase for insertion sequence [Streptococcus pneumoniae]|nr:hypothetical protein [Streptococcus pneumoniae]VFI47297.1 transposase for insertion sequence [Streptococcus pneumoniae]
MNETKKYLVIKAIAQGKKTKKRAYLHKNKKDYEEFTSEEIHSPQLQV